MKFGFFLVLLLAPSMLLAEVRESRLENELGYVLSRGSSHSETLFARSKAFISYNHWQHEGKLEALNVVDHLEQIRSAERYYAQEKTRYEFDGPSYVFASPSWEKVLGSGNEYVITSSAGAGYHLVQSDTQQLTVEAGPGYRHDETSSGRDSYDVIAAAGAKYQWKISPTASFEEEMRVEGGTVRTVSRSSAQLKTAINSRFSLKLRHDLRHDSNPLEDKPKTDTLVSVTLAYDIK